MKFLDKIIQDDMTSLINESYIDNIKNGSKIMITGCNGMIATYLLYFFCYLNDKKNKNVKIYALTRNMEKTSKKYADILKREDIEFISHDVNDEFDFDFNPNQLQYVSGKYYLNEGYNSNSDSSEGIWTSTDGLTWEKVYNGACETLLIKDVSFWMSQPSNSVSSPSLERGIYTSTDLQNWTCVWKPIDFSESHGAVDFQYVNNEFIFTTYYNIYKSTDGLSWDKVVPLGAGSLPKNNLTYDSSENQWLWYCR